MSLLSNLVDVWEMDGLAGSNEVGAKNGIVLTQSGAPGSAAGKINNARVMVAATPNRFQVASSAALQMAATSYEINCWVKFTTLAAFPLILAKEDGGGGVCEYHIEANAPANRLVFRSSHDGSTLVDVTANTFGGLATGTWYFISAWHDFVAHTLNISINNGPADSIGFNVVGSFVGTQDFAIGSRISGGIPLDGTVDQVSIRKTILSAAERAQLYNAGNGLASNLWATGRRRSPGLLGIGLI